MGVAGVVGEDGRLIGLLLRCYRGVTEVKERKSLMFLCSECSWPIFSWLGEILGKAA